MKKHVIHIIIALLVIVSSSAFAKDINQYIEKGEFAQAKGLLSKKLKKGDAKAHYELVRVYLAEDSYFEAIQAVKKIVKNGIGNGYREAVLLQTKGNELLNNGNNTGKLLLNFAAETNTSLYKKNCQVVAKQASKLLMQGKYPEAINLFDYSKQQNEAILSLPESMHADYDSNFKNNVGFQLSQMGQITKDPIDSIKLLAKACQYSPDFINTFNNHLVKLYKDKTRSERDRIASQYKVYITDETKKTLLPDPVWEMIPDSHKEYIGKGLGEKNAIPVASGINIRKGWRVFAKGKTFKTYRSKGWEEYSERYTAMQTYDTEGKPFGYMAPKGDKIVFWAERKVYP